MYAVFLHGLHFSSCLQVDFTSCPSFQDARLYWTHKPNKAFTPQVSFSQWLIKATESKLGYIRYHNSRHASCKKIEFPTGHGRRCHLGKLRQEAAWVTIASSGTGPTHTEARSQKTNKILHISKNVMNGAGRPSYGSYPRWPEARWRFVELPILATISCCS